MKASEIIDCTCTVASISSISRFACANVWSVRVATSGIYVTFVGVCFTFVNICQKKEKREKNENGIWFSFKSHTCTCIWKKWNTRLQFFGFMRFSGWTCESNRYCSNFFTLVQQRLSKAYAINCSCFATRAQNTLHKQQKKERIKVNHLWPHFLVIPNSPVQFCPFPVYPGWQSHTCDPLVLVQFAFSWQELFPLHSSMSMKSQKKKWDFKIVQKSPCISHYCVKECKPWLFSTFCWIARTQDCRTWWKKSWLCRNLSLNDF